MGHSLNSFSHHIESPLGAVLDIVGDSGEGTNFNLSTKLGVTKELLARESNNTGIG